jgi:hypothetical protein
MTTGFTTAEKVLFPLAAVLSVWGLVLWRRIVRRLQEQHPTVWEKLGSPRFGLTGRQPILPTIQFLLGSGHREVKDDGLADLARTWRTLNVAYLLVLGALGYQILRYGP